MRAVLGEVNQNKHYQLLGFTSPLSHFSNLRREEELRGIRCLLKKLISNVAGRLGLLDYDEVELNNLHRQVLHGEENQGQAKALSAAQALKRYQLALLHLSISYIHAYIPAYVSDDLINAGLQQSSSYFVSSIH